MSYKAPVKDMMFNIQHLAGLEQLTHIEAFADSTQRKPCLRSALSSTKT
jgi:Acyl-CoA dehydrogenase N terminal